MKGSKDSIRQVRSSYQIFAGAHPWNGADSEDLVPVMCKLMAPTTLTESSVGETSTSYDNPQNCSPFGALAVLNPVILRQL